MKLSIYTLRKTIYEGDTSRVTLPTAVGEVTILDHHEPYVTVLKPGSLRYEVPTSVELPQSHDKSPLVHGENVLPIKGGFLEVKEGNELRILADE